MGLTSFLSPQFVIVSARWRRQTLAPLSRHISGGLMGSTSDNKLFDQVCLQPLIVCSNKPSSQKQTWPEVRSAALSRGCKHSSRRKHILTFLFLTYFFVSCPVVAYWKIKNTWSALCCCEYTLYVNHSYKWKRHCVAFLGTFLKIISTIHWMAPLPLAQCAQLAWYRATWLVPVRSGEVCSLSF